MKNDYFKFPKIYDGPYQIEILPRYSGMIQSFQERLEKKLRKKLRADIRRRKNFTEVKFYTIDYLKPGVKDDN